MDSKSLQWVDATSTPWPESKLIINNNTLILHYLIDNFWSSTYIKGVKNVDDIVFDVTFVAETIDEAKKYALEMVNILEGVEK